MILINMLICIHPDVCVWKWLRENITRVKNTDKANKPFQFSFSPEKLDVETVMSMDQLETENPSSTIL